MFWLNELRARPRREVLEVLRDARFSHGVACPRCSSERVQRWGSFSGRQRYKCGGCRRTFSDLTGTPAAYLKRIELLPAYAFCMRRTLTIRGAARTLGVHPSTAFRWRHRFLGPLASAQAPELSGWIEVRSEWMPHSRKGERFDDRAPRTRGPVYYRTRYSGPRAVVLLACDRLGRVATDVMITHGPRAEGPDDIARLLAGRVMGHATLTSSDGRFGPVARLARREGWGFEESGFGWPAHDRTARGYSLRFRRWLPRFHGVATRYLVNYLSWHRHVDLPRRRGLEATLLRWPSGAGFG